MIESTLVLAQMRARLKGAVAATTGSATLSATSGGYARASGSFLDDGFRPGMEVLPSGFTSNPYGVVVGVSALALQVAGGRPTEGAGSGRAIVAGLPELRHWENVATEGEAAFKPIAGRPYIREEFVGPATSEVWTFPADGGKNQETGLYVVHWYGLAAFGAAGLRKCTDAVRARFVPGTPLYSSGATTLRVRADAGPFVSTEPRRAEGGWMVMTVRVPWLARSLNTVLV